MVCQITCKWGVFRTVKEYSGNYLYQAISPYSFLLYYTACISSFILPSCYSSTLPLTHYTRPLDNLTCSPGLLSIPWILPHLRPVRVASFCLELHLRHFTSNHPLFSPYMRTGGKGRRASPTYLPSVHLAITSLGRII